MPASTEPVQAKPAPRADQRGARRVALLLRAGKLVSADGEFLCILRDASTGGLKARLFHALPPTKRFALELANGESYPVELVWQRDGHAGFRFLASPVDVRGLIEERSALPKRDIRLRLTVPVRLQLAKAEFPAVLRDLSQHGAQVETQVPLAIGQQIALGGEGLPRLVARVRWRRGTAHGLIFQRGFKLDELAALVARLQQDGKAADPAPALTID